MIEKRLKSHPFVRMRARTQLATRAIADGVATLRARFHTFDDEFHACELTPDRPLLGFFFSLYIYEAEKRPGPGMATERGFNTGHKELGRSPVCRLGAHGS